MDVSRSDGRIKAITGEYRFYTLFNGRQSFKHASKNYFLFFVDKNQTSTGKGRWVVEDLLGKVKAPSVGEYLGLISHEGEEKCPSEVGKEWHQVWNHKSIDPDIRVNCVGEGKLFKRSIKRLNKFTFIYILPNLCDFYHVFFYMFGYQTTCI